MTLEELDRLSEQALGMLSGGQPQIPPDQLDSLAEQGMTLLQQLAPPELETRPYGELIEEQPDPATLARMDIAEEKPIGEMLPPYMKPIYKLGAKLLGPGFSTIASGAYGATAGETGVYQAYADKLAKLTGAEKSPEFFKDLKEDLEYWQEYSRMKGIGGIPGEVLKGLGSLLWDIPSIMKYGPWGLAIHGAVHGGAEAGMKGAAQGALQGALVHKIIQGIGALPSVARLPAWTTLGAATTPGGVEERVSGGLTWGILGLAGGNKPMTIPEFMENYPRVKAKISETTAKLVLKRIAPQTGVSSQEIKEAGGAKVLLDKVVEQMREPGVAADEVIKGKPAPTMEDIMAGRIPKPERLPQEAVPREQRIRAVPEAVRPELEKRVEPVMLAEIQKKAFTDFERGLEPAEIALKYKVRVGDVYKWQEDWFKRFPRAEEKPEPFAGGKIPKAEDIHAILKEMEVPTEHWGRFTEEAMTGFDPKKGTLKGFIGFRWGKIKSKLLREEKKFIPPTKRVTVPPEYEKLPEDKGIAISKTEKPEARYELKAEAQKLNSLIDKAIKKTKRGPKTTLQGKIVKMHILEEKSYAEIAKELNITEGNARVLLHEGVKKLRKDKEMRDILRKHTQKKFMDSIEKPTKPEETNKPGQIKYHHAGLPLGEKVQDAVNKIVDAFQIEPQFSRMGAPKTGRAFKLYEPKRNKELEWGAFKIQELYEKDLTAKDYQDIIFLAASRKKLMGLPSERFEKLNSSVKKVINFFEGYKEQFKKVDAPVDWPASRIRELKERVKSSELTKEETTSIYDELGFLEGAGVKYVHIPRSWMEDLYAKHPKEAPKIITQFFRERKTYDIEELANYLKEKEIITDKDLDIRRIMASYAHKAGHKLAIAKIIKAAKEEGMILDVEEAPKGWQKLPQKTFPTLQGKKAHPLFVDYFEKNLQKLKFLPPQMGKVLAAVKLFTFYNPIILPMYDMYQAWWTGSIRSFGPKMRTPRSVWRAARSMYLKDKHYWNFLDHGGSSTPWTPGFKDYMKRVNEMVDKNPLFKDIKRYVTNPYRLSWEAAWMGDKFVRMITYHHFIQKDFSPMKAAQYTAKFHADYASVPPATRKWLNKILYTPSFKITMIAAQTDMVKSAGNWLVKAGKVPENEKVMAKALVGLVSGMAIRHAILKKLGFKTDQFALRYYQEIDTDKGKKELVFYSATPDNVIMRFLNRFKNIPLEENKLEALFKGARWELHPLWQRAIEVGTNRSDEGKRIYNPLDMKNPERIPNMAWDATKYLATRIFKFTEQIPGMGASRRLETVRAMEKDMGKIAQLLNWFVIPYTRNVKERRVNFKINKLRKIFLQMHKERPPKDEEESSKRVDRLQEILRKLLEED